MPNNAIQLLYIDDDAALGRLVQRILARRGYAVTHAGSAEAAFAQLESQPYDVIILDHDLGTTSGLEVMAALTERGHVPAVVYVTASAELSIAVSALKAGGYRGYLNSEYEGNRHIQDIQAVDSFGQVKLHQQLMKTLIAGN